MEHAGKFSRTWYPQTGHEFSLAGGIGKSHGGNDGHGFPEKVTGMCARYNALGTDLSECRASMFREAGGEPGMTG